jgi:FimV-like protein
VEVYDTERDQIDAIKKWWKENGKAVVIGAILGFGSLIGWQQWQANVKAARESASLEYDVMMSELNSGNIESVKERGGQILSKYPKTPYAALSAMSLAKVYIDAGDFNSARTYLQQVINQDKQPHLKKVAQIRLARLLLAQGKADEALSTVNSIDVGGFAVAVNELKGDIQVALGNRSAARDAYQHALDAMEPGVDSTVLKMKLDEAGGPEGKA